MSQGAKHLRCSALKQWLLTALCIGLWDNSPSQNPFKVARKWRLCFSVNVYNIVIWCLVILDSLIQAQRLSAKHDGTGTPSARPRGLQAWHCTRRRGGPSSYCCCHCHVIVLTFCWRITWIFYFYTYFSLQANIMLNRYFWVFVQIRGDWLSKQVSEPWTLIFL